MKKMSQLHLYSIMMQHSDILWGPVMFVATCLKIIL